MKITINDSCSLCGVCESECPTLCIHDGKIIADSCIHCFECLDVCPSQAFEYKRGKQQTSKKQTGRRSFLMKSFISVVALIPPIGLGNFLSRKIPDKIKRPIPPGGRSWSNFVERCTFCGMCVSVCPTKVLSNTPYEGYPQAYLRPSLEYPRSYCSYECNACLAICPSDAISYLKLEEKQLVRIGKAKLNKDLCIPFAKKRDCAACAEHCPSGTFTMKMDPKISETIRVPVVDDKYCIGCGVCAWSCPVIPERAITIIPETHHSVAYNPKLKDPKKRKKRVTTETEFPF